jgi:hypothetical protein
MRPSAFHENIIGTLALVSTGSYALATKGGVAGTNGRSLAMRELYLWAILNEYVKHDPTLNMSVKIPKSDGYYTWT